MLQKDYPTALPASKGLASSYTKQHLDQDVQQFYEEKKRSRRIELPYSKSQLKTIEEKGKAFGTRGKPIDGLPGTWYPDLYPTGAVLDGSRFLIVAKASGPMSRYERNPYGLVSLDDRNHAGIVVLDLVDDLVYGEVFHLNCSEYALVKEVERILAVYPKSSVYYPEYGWADDVSEQPKGIAALATKNTEIKEFRKEYKLCQEGILERYGKRFLEDVENEGHLFRPGEFQLVELLNLRKPKKKYCGELTITSLFTAGLMWKAMQNVVEFDGDFEELNKRETFDYSNAVRYAFYDDQKEDPHKEEKEEEEETMATAGEETLEEEEKKATESLKKMRDFSEDQISEEIVGMNYLELSNLQTRAIRQKEAIANAKETLGNARNMQIPEDSKAGVFRNIIAEAELECEESEFDKESERIDRETNFIIEQTTLHLEAYKDVPKTTKFLSEQMVAVIQKKLEKMKELGAGDRERSVFSMEESAKAYSNRGDLSFLQNKIRTSMGIKEAIKKWESNPKKVTSTIRRVLSSTLTESQLAKATNYLVEEREEDPNAVSCLFYRLAKIYQGEEKTGRHIWVKIFFMNLIDIKLDVFDLEIGVGPYLTEVHELCSLFDANNITFSNTKNR